MATSTAAELAAIASQTGQNKGNQTYGYSNGGDAPVSIGNATFKASDNVMVPNGTNGTVNAALKSPVASLSTDGAAATLNSGLTKLNNISPTTAPGYVAPTAPVKDPNATQTPPPKAYFTNGAQQEAEFTQDQLNDPATQKYLSDNGYVQTKTEGPTYNPSNPGTATQQDINDIDGQIASNFQDWKSYNVDQDPAFQAKAANITAQYDQLTAAMNKSNAARAAALTTLGYRTGATQYAGSIQAGIEGEELSQANQRISDLTMKEQSAITDARTAYQDAKYTDFSHSMDALEMIRNNKSDELDKYNDKIAAAVKAANDADLANKKDINSIALNAAQNGATGDVLDAIGKTTDPAAAIKAAGDYLQTGTGQVGDYLMYKRDALAKGLTPLEYSDWKVQDDAQTAKEKANEAYSSSYASEAGRAAATAATGSSDKVQQGLEQQFRTVLAKEFGSRSGTYGLNDAKVSQANKLATLFNQAYDPKTGNYNLNASQYGELAEGLASLISGNAGGASDSDVSALKTATAKGDWNKVYTYVTGSTANGSTQDIIKSLAASVEREANQAVADRDADEQKLIGLAPTDLDPARRDALIQAQSIQYSGIDGVAKSEVNNYLTQHPDQGENISAMYKVPGATDQAIWNYIQQQENQ